MPTYEVKASSKTSFTPLDEKVILATSLNFPLWSGLQSTNQAKAITNLVVSTSLNDLSSGLHFGNRECRPMLGKRKET